MSFVYIFYLFIIIIFNIGFFPFSLFPQENKQKKGLLSLSTKHVGHILVPYQGPDEEALHVLTYLFIL